jgi:hypothetical protein
MKLTQAERIARAKKIREEKERVQKENTDRYLNSSNYRIQKLITLIFVAYAIITFIPIEPRVFAKEETVMYVDNTMGTNTSRVITITTDQGNDYLIQGRSMGKHAFSVGDQIISMRNLLYKTRDIVHVKYEWMYPIDKQLGLLIFFTALTVVMIICILSRDYRIERGFYMVTLVNSILFYFYLES